MDRSDSAKNLRDLIPGLLGDVVRLFDYLLSMGATASWVYV